MKRSIVLPFVLAGLSAIAFGCSHLASQSTAQANTQANTQANAQTNAQTNAMDHGSMNHGNMDHGSMDHGGMDHGSMNHGTMAVPAGQPVPTVKLIVHPDSKQGWNLEAQVTNFRFAPERVNQTSAATEGHAHIYVNDKKLTRLYGNWYYLESLPAGQQKITVALNANGHEALTHNNQPIQSTVTIEVPNQPRSGSQSN
jgi:hypothetical protein